MTTVLAVSVDDIQVDGATLDNGGFEDGNLDNYITIGLVNILDGGEFPEYVRTGSYSCGLTGIHLGEQQASFHALEYVLSSSAGDLVSIWFQICTYEVDAGDSIVLSFYAYDSEYAYVDGVTYTSYEDTIPGASSTWLNATFDMSTLGATRTIDVIIGTIDADFEPPAEISSLIFNIDGITLTESDPWTGFQNGDFETGDLTGWTTSGSASISTIHTHGGTYSCIIEGSGNIAQLIDLTDYEQLSIPYYITSNSGYVTISILDGSTVMQSWTDTATTDGWYTLRFDVASYNDIYAIKVAASSADIYIDDIAGQATYDNTGIPYKTFDDGSWFHYTNGWYDSESSIRYTSGIDDSRCAYIYVGHRGPGTPVIASIYNYIDVTNFDTVKFWYKIPIFNPGYYNMGGAWFKMTMEQTGSATISQTIADADNGAITDWTQYSIDVSDLTGVYKLTLYGETMDAGYTLHPYATIYIDDAQGYSTPINIQQSFYIRHQYDTDNRYLISRPTHMLQTLKSLPPDWMFTHRMNDLGEVIGYDEMSMTDLGAIHKVINLYNILHMKIRRVK